MRCGSAFSWGSRDEEGKSGGDEERGELHFGMYLAVVMMQYRYGSEALTFEQWRVCEENLM